MHKSSRGTVLSSTCLLLRCVLCLIECVVLIDLCESDSEIGATLHQAKLIVRVSNI